MRTLIFKFTSTALFAGAIAWTAPATAQETLFGVSLLGNESFRVNTATGNGSLVGSLDPQAILPVGLALRGTELYTFSLTTGAIHQINQMNGSAGPPIEIDSPPAFGEGDLAFRSDGIGYLAAGSPSNGEPTQLFKFDLTGATSTSLIGSISAGMTSVGMDALAFSTSDVLYGVSTGTRSLYTIDPATGLATLVGLLGLPDPFTPDGDGNLPVKTGSPVAGMSFNAADDLYLAFDDKLYLVNKSSGQADLVATPQLFGVVPGIGDFAGISGLAFAAPVMVMVPRPDPKVVNQLQRSIRASIARARRLPDRTQGDAVKRLRKLAQILRLDPDETDVIRVKFRLRIENASRIQPPVNRQRSIRHLRAKLMRAINDLR